MIVLIVQARMGSTRLPGKMLQSLGSKSLFEWVAIRCAKARKVDSLVLATSASYENDALASMADQIGMQVYRGSENDVLGRFSDAAKLNSATCIVRVCADNPFVDAAHIDRLIDFYNEDKLDYACNHRPAFEERHIDGFGAEIVSMKTLTWLNHNVHTASHREHVTSYIHEQRHRFSCGSPPPLLEEAFTDFSFDVDTKEQLEGLRQLVDMGVSIDSSAKDIVDLYQKALGKSSNSEG